MDALNLTDRILLTLANSLSPEYQYGPKDLKDIKERPDFMIDEESGAEGRGLGAYAYSFRSQEGPFSGSGYFKIASPARYRPPKENEGWGLLGKEEATGTEVWFRKVRKSETVNYNEVEATLVKGNFVLTASFRRPAEEPAAQARQMAEESFARLLDNARKYGLLYRILVELVDESAGEPLPEDSLLNLKGQDDEETSVRLRLREADFQGKPLENVEVYTIKLGGFLGKYARLEGAAFNQAKKQYEVHDPPADGIQVSVVFPAMKEGNFAKALEQDATMRRGFGIVLNVEATFKAAEKGGKP
jgi:hypothetical protein